MVKLAGGEGTDRVVICSRSGCGCGIVVRGLDEVVVMFGDAYKDWMGGGRGCMVRKEHDVP
jgi:hypothetical protein